MQSSQVLIQLTATPISAKNPSVSIDQKQNPSSTFKAALNREVKNQTNNLESKQNAKKSEAKEKLEPNHVEKNIGSTSNVKKASQENESQEDLKTSDSVSSTEVPVATNQYLHPLEIIRDLQALEQEKKDELPLTENQNPNGNLASFINIGKVETNLPTEKAQDLSDESQTMMTTELSLGSQALGANNNKKNEASTDNKQGALDVKTVPIDELAVQRPAGPPEAPLNIKNLSENDKKVDTVKDTKIASVSTKASDPTTTTSIKAENNSKLTANINSAFAKVMNAEVPATGVRPQTIEVTDPIQATSVTIPLVTINTTTNTESTDTKVQKVDTRQITGVQDNTSLSAKIEPISAKQFTDLSTVPRSASNISEDALPVASSTDLTQTTNVIPSQPFYPLGGEEFVKLDSRKNSMTEVRELNLTTFPQTNTIKTSSETNVTIIPNQAGEPNQTDQDSDLESKTMPRMIETLQNINIAVIGKTQVDSDSQKNSLEKSMEELSDPNIAPPPQANTVKAQSETIVTIMPNQTSLPNQAIRNGVNLKDGDRDSSTKLGILETVQNPNIAATEKKQSDSESRINSLEKKHDFESSLKERMANNAMPPVVDEATIANANPTVNEVAVAKLEDNHIGPRVGSKIWDQAIGQKVIWMVAGGEQSAELSLNPPDLGPLQVVLSISDNFVDASFISSHLDVREAIEAAAPKLREMMDNAGISLSGFSVSSQSSSSNMNFSNEQNRQSPSSSSRMNKVEIDSSVRASATPVTRTQLGAVDTFV